MHRFFHHVSIVLPVFLSHIELCKSSENVFEISKTVKVMDG